MISHNVGVFFTIFFTNHFLTDANDVIDLYKFRSIFDYSLIILKTSSEF